VPANMMTRLHTHSAGNEDRAAVELDVTQRRGFALMRTANVLHRRCSGGHGSKAADGSETESAIMNHELRCVCVCVCACVCVCVRVCVCV